MLLERIKGNRPSESPHRVPLVFPEHVWEHLSAANAAAAARTCFRYLRPSADDHKVPYRHDSFAAVFIAPGFVVRLYEYCDESVRSQCHERDPRDGMVWRLLRYDPRDRDVNSNYSSIVLDATKPAQQDCRA